MTGAHNYLVAVDPPRESLPRRWKCEHCGEVGTLGEMQERPCVRSRPATDAELIEAIEGGER